MALEEVAPGVAADGNGLVLWVPAGGIADVEAPTVAELTDPDVVPLTYSLTPDGFRQETTENVITSGRYTLKQIIEIPGTVLDAIEVQYVYTGTASDTARLTLEAGVNGYIVHRLGYPNETGIAAAQIVDVIPVTAGIQRKVPPVANSELQRVQKLTVRAAIGRDVAVVSGG